jgi:hypothetical protein
LDGYNFMGKWVIENSQKNIEYIEELSKIVKNLIDSDIIKRLNQNS